VEHVNKGSYRGQLYLVAYGTLLRSCNPDYWHEKHVRYRKFL